jgi:hypothetical protein
MTASAARWRSSTPTNDADAAVLKDPLAREAVADRIAQAIDTFLQERDSTG